MSSAMNNGLRSRLSSSTSLFRAGSQKSVVDGVDATVRRESQRSAVTALMPPPPAAIEAALSVAAAVAATSGGTGGGGGGGGGGSGWHSEQGSPLRPASLVLGETTTVATAATATAMTRDWPSASNHSSPSDAVFNLLGAAPTAALAPLALSPVTTLSPPVPNQRFSTTNVELISEQVHQRYS